MKKFLVIIILILICTTIHAQKPAGTTTIYPRIGISLSKYSSDKIYTDIQPADYVNAKFKTGFTVGAELQHQISNVIALSGGLLYSRMGTKFEPIDDLGVFNINTDNINIPVMLIATSNIGLNFKLGLQPAIRISKSFDKILNRFILSIPAGISYNFRNFELDLRYNYGLTPVYKDNAPAANQHSIMFTIGYGIDL